MLPSLTPKSVSPSSNQKVLPAFSTIRRRLVNAPSELTRLISTFRELPNRGSSSRAPVSLDTLTSVATN